MLVLLRISIGWHFLYQGITKYQDGDFSSEPFLSQAKGPFAPLIEQMRDDPQGREFLDPDRRDQVLSLLDESFDRWKSHYRLSDSQLGLGETVLKNRRDQLGDYLDDIKEDTQTYFHDLDRLESARRAAHGGDKSAAKDDQDGGMIPAPDFLSLPFEQKRLWDKKQELEKRSKAWIAKIEKYQQDLKSDLFMLLDEEQRQQAPVKDPLSMGQKRDMLVMYSNLAIGACLILGLFTRLACLGGGLFLALIVIAQPDYPGVYPLPHPSAGRAFIVNKEFIEMLALFALATTRVGRWGGLDFLVHHLLIRPVFRSRGTS